MIALGFGHSDPHHLLRALIAQAFDAVRYPIYRKSHSSSEAARRGFLEIRHSSLYARAIFYSSPYCKILKPTLVESFNYKRMDWADLLAQPPPYAKPNVGNHG
jgi:hypothetical protein